MLESKIYFYCFKYYVLVVKKNKILVCIFICEILIRVFLFLFDNNFFY